MPVLGVAVFGGACAAAGAALAIWYRADEVRRLREHARHRDAQVRQMARTEMQRRAGLIR